MSKELIISMTQAALILSMVLTLCLMAWNTDKANADRRTLISEEMEVPLNVAHRIDRFNKMEFYSDLTTGLCFAYLWGGPGGGTMMANVPCEGLSTTPFRSGQRIDND